MSQPTPAPPRPAAPADPEALAEALRATGYLPDEGLTTAAYLALAMHRPLFLEGEAGVGKTALAHALAEVTGRPMYRLQCYEGLEASQALYDWDFGRQLLHLRAAEAAGTGGDTAELEAGLYDRRFLLARPLLQALEDAPSVLLVDEIDRADDEFEAFLLELLSDFTISIPELGTVRAAVPPLVVLTSNRTREVHDALKRRCLYHWLEHPDFEREVAILRSRLPAGDRGAGPPGGPGHGQAAQPGPAQAPRHRRGHGLGHRAAHPGRPRARPGHRGPHPRRGAQVPRGHRPGARPDPGSPVRVTAAGRRVCVDRRQRDVVEVVLGFARTLRHAGVAASPDRVEAMLSAVGHLDVLDADRRLLGGPAHPLRQPRRPGALRRRVRRLLRRRGPAPERGRAAQQEQRLAESAPLGGRRRGRRRRRPRRPRT